VRKAKAAALTRALCRAPANWPSGQAVGLTACLVDRIFRRYACDVLDWSRCSAVERIPGKVGGAWVFKGTRVPVKALFENLESGARVDDFLGWFPGVTREQVDAVLQHAELSLVEA
jgi:uncharacterized protein (DUF433 family)